MAESYYPRLMTVCAYAQSSQGHPFACFACEVVRRVVHFDFEREDEGEGDVRSEEDPLAARLRLAGREVHHQEY